MFKMGQPVSKNAQGNVAYPPFENYAPAGAGLTTAQYPPPGGRVVNIDDRDGFWDQDPVYVPDSQPPPRTVHGNFGPPGMPRRRPPFGPPYGPPDSITQAPGYASALRDQMIVDAESAPRYRSAPPRGGPSQVPQNRQPYIKTVRTVINEPRGYAPPGQSQGYQVQSQQASSQQPANVLYYDPKTGALSNSGHQHSAPTGPVACGSQSCAPQVAYQAAPQSYTIQQPAPQVAYQVQPQVAYQTQPQVAYQTQPQVAFQTQPQVAYQTQPQMFGYQQAAQPLAFAYPQQQQSQPIVVPGQLYTATGGVQQLG